MSETKITLPARLALSSFIHVAEAWPNSGDVLVDFSQQQWVKPSGTVGLSCLVKETLDRGDNVRFDVDGCENAGYWARMHFFENFGAGHLVEVGERTPQARFSTIRHVREIEAVDEITGELVVDVVSPSTAARQTLSHVVSEALNNICQHSFSSGYCASQLYKSEGQKVWFCIADRGVGLLSSLTASYAPQNDRVAIDLALRVGVTGRSRAAQMAQPKNMRNRGVGLSAIHRLIVENGGTFVLWSGSAAFVETPAMKALRNEVPWQGTLLAGIVPRTYMIKSFADIMGELIAALNISEASRRPRLSRHM